MAQATPFQFHFIVKTTGMIRESKSKKNVNNADISVPTGKQGIEKLQNSHKGLNCSITNVIHSVKDILSY